MGFRSLCENPHCVTGCFCKFSVENVICNGNLNLNALWTSCLYGLKCHLKLSCNLTRAQHSFVQMEETTSFTLINLILKRFCGIPLCRVNPIVFSL